LRLSSSSIVLPAEPETTEFEIAKSLRRHPIPIGATGHAAHKIWEEVYKSLNDYYPSGGVKGHFETLGNANKTDEDILNAIFAIMKRVNS